MGAIINAGIKTVVCFDDKVDYDDLAEVLAEHAGIAITRLPKLEAVKGIWRTGRHHGITLIEFR